MRDIRLTEADILGSYLYRLMVDGLVYDSFISDKQLTLSEMNDVEGYYREGLTDYLGPGMVA